MTNNNQPTTHTLNLRITGMDCVDCAVKLEKGVTKLDGVQTCSVNFAAAKMRIEGSADAGAVTARIESLGYGVADENTRYTPRTPRRQIIELLRQPRNSATLIGGLFLLAGFAAQSFTALPALPLFFTGGLFGLYFPAKAGWGALRAGQGLDMNVLMTIAAVGAFSIGETAEAATVIILFSLGRWPRTTRGTAAPQAGPSPVQASILEPVQASRAPSPSGSRATTATSGSR